MTSCRPLVVQRRYGIKADDKTTPHVLDYERTRAVAARGPPGPVSCIYYVYHWTYGRVCFCYIHMFLMEFCQNELLRLEMGSGSGFGSGKAAVGARVRVTGLG